MNRFTCTVCGKDQYSASSAETPCIYCKSPVKIQKELEPNRTAGNSIGGQMVRQMISNYEKSAH
jgi:hypothetical protein